MADRSERSAYAEYQIEREEMNRAAEALRPHGDRLRVLSRCTSCRYYQDKTSYAKNRVHAFPQCKGCKSICIVRGSTPASAACCADADLDPLTPRNGGGYQRHRGILITARHMSGAALRLLSLVEATTLLRGVPHLSR